MKDRVSDPSGYDATTMRHEAAQNPLRNLGQPVLVMAYPRPAALPILGREGTLGRRDLAPFDVQDGKISKRHLTYTLDGDTLVVRDAGSTNGIWVDGGKVPEGDEVALRGGDVLRMGDTLFVYRPSFRGSLHPDEPLCGLVSPYGLRALRGTLDALAARQPATVLVTGDTGSGKELTSRAVAAALGRAEPLVSLNVAGVPAGVFEAQVFGHVAGAFSGASAASDGVVVAHEGGSVVFDEIGELDLGLQPKLLRLIDNREVQPVGGSAPRKVDVLIVAATHRDLQARVESGHFRQDLLARLDATHVRLPPLRERPEDVFSVLDALARAEGCAWGAIEVEAVERLLLHDWPTNVRGIKRLLARLPVTEGAVALQRWAVDDVIGAPAPREAVETSTLTAQSVKEALAAADGNQSAAARRLGVSRGKLRRFLDKAT